MILASSFNFFTADRFIVSDFNIDAREDGLYENTGYADYLTNFINLDGTALKNNFDYLSKKFHESLWLRKKRLYIL